VIQADALPPIQAEWHHPPKVSQKTNPIMSDNADVSPGPAAARNSSPSQIVEHFFRHETGRLHGALTRLLGPGNLTLVEDVAQGALLQAMRTWSIGGVPANPSAWITRVAINLARDTMRHRRMSFSKEPNIITHIEQLQPDAPPVAIGENEIRDDALRLMFVCCHPLLSSDAQVVLALKVLCGFSTAEIARAFLSSDAAIDKQLTRTKQRIRDANIGFDLPEGTELSARLDGVLAALYLLFNEGYKATAGDRLLREDLCREAVRLMALLVAHPAGNTPRSHALLALMLFTAARFPSRLDDQGDLLRLDDQDRSQWDQDLIARGLFHLAQAAQGDHLSEYHIQAGIAACHCMAPDYESTDWQQILRHYDDLEQIKPSPIVALNRAVAVAHLHGAQAGLDVIQNIAQRDRLESHYLLHAVTGELQWRLKNFRAAAESFRRALKLAEVGPEQMHLTRMLERSTDIAEALG
jgi:RNA polymerase sigma factor (sigma-70 family)